MTTGIERYRMFTYKDPDGYEDGALIGTVEDEEGPWVYYVDHAATVARMEAENARLRAALENSDPECICGHVGSLHIRDDDGRVNCAGKNCLCTLIEPTVYRIEADERTSALASEPQEGKHG
jgi:hypothetical protein